MWILNLLTNSKYSNVENERLRAIASRFRSSKEDTVYVSTSRLCPTCSVYNRRIFSLYGRYRSFPILPSFLYQKRCPCCHVYIGYSHYFPGITGNLKKDIAYSNRPFIDSRSNEEVDLWNERILRENIDNKIAKDYSWLLENVPDIAPKSIGGYKRMISSNSSNYQKLIEAAAEKGYTI